MRYTTGQLDRAAEAWRAEQERWIFRRRMGKDGWEIVRLDDAKVIVEDAMEVTQAGVEKIIAEAEFETLRDRACAQAALIAARPGRKQIAPPGASI